MSTVHSANLQLQANGTGTVTVAGHDITGVVAGVMVVADPRGGTVVRLELAVHETTVDGEAHITIPAGTHRTLVALGWTPPGGEPDGGG